MNTKTAGIIAGLAIAVAVIVIIILPFFSGSSGSKECLLPEPGPLFSIDNFDTNRSHIVDITISNPDNQTLAAESYVVGARSTILSEFRSTSKAHETFLITIVVDGKNTSHEIIDSATLCCTSFSIDDKGSVVYPPDMTCRDVPCRR